MIWRNVAFTLPMDKRLEIVLFLLFSWAFHLKQHSHFFSWKAFSKKTNMLKWKFIETHRKLLSLTFVYPFRLMKSVATWKNCVFVSLTLYKAICSDLVINRFMEKIGCGVVLLIYVFWIRYFTFQFFPQKKFIKE